jgi:hypothetical protein
MASETMNLKELLPPTLIKSSQGRKRKKADERPARAPAIDLKAIDGELDAPKPKKRKAEATKAPDTEKRLKRHRESAPSSIKAIYDRAVNQR